jgi:outer membrane protein assembly factor BamB
MRARARTLTSLVLFVAASVGTVTTAQAAPGDILWESRGDIEYIPESIYASPGGETVYVTDDAFGAHAFDALTGESRWHGFWPNADLSEASAMSPDGATLYLAGGMASSGKGYAIVAYDTATGERSWTQSVGHGVAHASAVAVSPDGGVIFLTGYPGTVVALRASNGKKLWVVRSRHDFWGVALAVDPNGRRVYATRSIGFPTDVVTTAYSTRSGRELWTRRYERGTNWDHAPTSIAVDGSSVFVTGSTEPVHRADSSRYLTLAYDADSGHTSWTRLYNGHPGEWDFPADLALDPTTATLIVTGLTGFDSDIGTVAYDTATGETRWTARYDGGGESDGADDITVDALTGLAYILGTVWGAGNDELDDFGIIAYETSTGALSWDARYGGPGDLREQAAALVLSADGETLFVTGSSADGGGSYDTVVLAFKTTSS